MGDFRDTIVSKGSHVRTYRFLLVIFPTGPSCIIQCDCFTLDTDSLYMLTYQYRETNRYTDKLVQSKNILSAQIHMSGMRRGDERSGTASQGRWAYHVGKRGHITRPDAVKNISNCI